MQILTEIASMYITLMAVTLGGITNMFVVRLPYFKQHKKPIDGGLCLKDGKRLFGDNKTWQGAASMIVLCMFYQVIWGFACRVMGLEHLNQFYDRYPNSLLYNIITGAALGLIYILCELPNSFIKRRLNITPGKTSTGLKGKIFFVIDQIDSQIGVSALLFPIAGISVLKYIAYVVLGGLTHISINLILYKMKVRRNI